MCFVCDNGAYCHKILGTRNNACPLNCCVETGDLVDLEGICSIYLFSILSESDARASVNAAPH